MDARDIAQLDYFLGRGNVVALRRIADGDNDGLTIGLRHDVDDRGWPVALAMAEREAHFGWCSTYYFLHTAPYWGTPGFIAGVERIVALGHEVGLHNNALTVWYRTGDDPFQTFYEALAALREWSGAPIRSTAGHGDEDCYVGRFVNYSMFEGCDPGPAWRSFEELTGMEPRPLSDFGLDYHGDHLPRSCYISDSGGRWTHDLTRVVCEFPFETNTIVLQHPDWYPVKLLS